MRVAVLNQIFGYTHMHTHTHTCVCIYMVLLGYSGKQDVVQEASDLKEFHFKNIMLQDIFVSLKINSVCLVYVI